MEQVVRSCMTVFSAVELGCDFQFRQKLMRLQWLGKAMVPSPILDIFWKLPLKFSNRIDSVHYHVVGSGKLKGPFTHQVNCAVFLIFPSHLRDVCMAFTSSELLNCTICKQLFIY